MRDPASRSESELTDHPRIPVEIPGGKTLCPPVIRLTLEVVNRKERYAMSC